MDKIIRSFFALLMFFTVLVIWDNSVHAKGVSVYENMDYSPVYDYDYYLSNNPDVAAYFSGNPELVLSHFVNYGMREGRKSHPDFDFYSYKKAHRDLRMAFGNDKKAYYMHYIIYGQQEKRVAIGVDKFSAPITVINGIDFSKIYDFEYYYEKHRDVAKVFGYDDYKVLKHFAEFGLYEKRQAKENILPTDPEYIELQEKYKPFVSREAKYPVAANLIRGGDLRQAFEIAHSIPYFGHNDQIPSDPIWTIEQFADFGFTNKKGNCYVMAAMFYEMAYVLGYNPRQMAGWVPSRTRGITQHSWVEIDMDGETWVFDPDFTYSTKKDGFKFKYGTKGTWKYENYSPM